MDHVCGIACVTDDIIIHALIQEEHDQHTMLSCLCASSSASSQVLKKLSILVTFVTFMDHSILSCGVHPDPKELSAITNVTVPEDVTQLGRFTGVIN